MHSHLAEQLAVRIALFLMHQDTPSVVFLLRAAEQLAIVIQLDCAGIAAVRRVGVGVTGLARYSRAVSYTTSVARPFSS